MRFLSSEQTPSTISDPRVLAISCDTQKPQASSQISLENRKVPRTVTSIVDNIPSWIILYTESVERLLKLKTLLEAL
jgi:hypothetical protein